MGGVSRAIDRIEVIAETIRRAWSLGAGPGSDPVTIDLSSTICEVHGKAEKGAAYGYTRQLGYSRCWPRGPTPASPARAARKGSTPDDPIGTYSRPSHPLESETPL